MLNAVGVIGGQTGLAGAKMTIVDEGGQIQDKDADLLLIGSIPQKLKDDKHIDLLVDATQSW